MATEDKDGNSTQSHRNKVDNQEGSPTILVTEVGEPPDIAEADRDRDAGEKEVERMAPVSSYLSLVIIGFLGHIWSRIQLLLPLLLSDHVFCSMYFMYIKLL